MCDEVIKLIDTETFSDKIGNQKEKIVSEREVFAKKKSVSMSETYKAWGAERNPSAVFVLSDFLDYEDEKYIEHEGRRYRIIRTYNPEDTTKLELICEIDEENDTV